MRFFDELCAALAMFMLFVAGAMLTDDIQPMQSWLDNVPAAVMEEDYEEDCAPPDDPDYDCGCDGGPVLPFCDAELEENSK